MPDYPYLPMSIDDVPDHLVDLWAEAWSHDGIVDALWYGEWPCCRELEPPRRPPSWYPGQPDPPRPRVRPCTCMYVLTDVPDAPGPWLPIQYPGRRTVWVTRCFVIVFDCPHHGDARYDPELLRGYTPEGEALFWETLAEDERRP